MLVKPFGVVFSGHLSSLKKYITSFSFLLLLNVLLMMSGHRSMFPMETTVFVKKKFLSR